MNDIMILENLVYIQCHVHLYKPVDENSSHFFIDVKLVGHVLGTRTTCNLYRNAFIACQVMAIMSAKVL